MQDIHIRFNSLYVKYYSMVHQLCLGFVKGNEDVANDLTQEAFINCWNALPRFRGDSSPKTWIYRITVNTCLKYVRDRRNLTDPIEPYAYKIAEEEPAIEDNRQNLYCAIGKLKEVDRLIIMMMLDELEYPEIAEIIGISEGNLRVKIHRIKKQLKNLLKNE